jgi:hypothetical protein
MSRLDCNGQVMPQALRHRCPEAYMQQSNCPARLATAVSLALLSGNALAHGVPMLVPWFMSGGAAIGLIWGLAAAYFHAGLLRSLALIVGIYLAGILVVSLFEFSLAMLMYLLLLGTLSVLLPAVAAFLVAHFLAKRALHCLAHRRERAT